MTGSGPLATASLLDAAMALSGLADGAIWALALVFARVGAAVWLLPAFGETALPARVRLGAGLAMTLAVAGAAPGLPPLPAGPGAALPLLGGEVVAGLVFGMLVRLVVMALQTAGAVAAQATALSQVAGAIGADPSPAMTQALILGGIALACALGLPERAVAYLVGSYDAWPAATWPDLGALTQTALDAIADAFALGVALAAPFLAATLLVNLALGAVGRAMPAFQALAVSAPATTWGGLALFALAAPAMIDAWTAALLAALAP